MGTRGPKPVTNKWFRDYTQNDVDYGTLDPAWWPYLAGLMDGEGTIRAHLSKTLGTIQVELSNTHLPTLEEAAQRLGGVVRECRMNGRGGTHQVYEFGMWRSARVLAMLERIFPYLRIKRWKAALAIMFLRRAGLNCRGNYDRQLLTWLRQIGGYQRF